MIEACQAFMDSTSNWIERYGQTVLIALGFAIGTALIARYRWKTRGQKHVMIPLEEIE